MRAKSAISGQHSAFGHKLTPDSRWLRAGRAAAAGFTLIELLTSIVILLMITAMLGAAFTAASTAWRSSERDIERFQNARAALDLLARDLTQAVVSTNVPFYANSNSLAFVASNNDDTNSVSMAEIVYRLNLDQTSVAPFQLTRRYTRSTYQSPPVSNPQWDFYNNLVNWPATVDYTNIVCGNVVSFTAQCYDNAGNPIGATLSQSYWNSATNVTVWTEVGVPATTPAMFGVPPAYIDVHLAVVDTKTASLLASLPNSSAAFANVLRQGRRDFNVYVKIPQR